MSRVLCLALLAALLLAAPAAADESSLYRGPGPRPGPDVLYRPLATAPQLTNAGVWQADPIMVSGATAYRKGEFLYQDFLYDDHGARGARDPEDPRSGDDTFSPPYGTYTYPRDDKYAENAADLVELRVRPLADATAFRLTYNTMLDPELVATTIALGDGVPAAPFPHGAGVSAPASFFLTVHGGSADFKRAGTLADVGPAPTASVDRERRQIEVRVPHAAFNPRRDRVRMAAGSGLWDQAAGAYLVPQSPAASATAPGGRGALPSPPAFFNVAFRSETSNPDGAQAGEEPLPQIEGEGGTADIREPSWWRDEAQGRALTDGTLAPFSATVDFGKLADGAEDDSDVPRTGVLNRILVSHQEPQQGVDFDRECGRAFNCEGELLGRLQPYSLYVPDKPQPASGWGMTLLLHSLAANYNQFSGSRNQQQFGDRGPGSLVITPSGRGPDGWYYGLAGADTFEVWADVAARYRLDPAWTAIAGYSMGGYGTYKLGAQYPDLFAKAQPTVGPPTLGISPDAQQSTGGRSTSTFFMLPAFRNIPIMMWVGSTDQLVPITGTTAQAQRFDALGYRYVFDVFSPADHFALAINDQFGPAAEFLGTDKVDRDPPHVSYVVNPKMDFPEVGTVGDHAYWLSKLKVRDAGGEEPRGLIDVRSEGFGVGDPKVGDTQRSGPMQLPDTKNFPLSYVRQQRSWGEAPRTPVRDRLVITAGNVARVRVDPKRARVSCDAALDVTTDGPVEVVLEGCSRTETFGAGSANGAAARSCRAAVGFVRAGVRPRGSRLGIDAALLGAGRYTADVFLQSRGRTIVGNRRVAVFRGRQGSFTWAARGRRVRDGVYIVRFRRALAGGRVDVRRVVVERRRGTFRLRPDYYRRVSCGSLASFKLERPVFGGRRNRALGVAFRVARPSSVTVRLVRGGKTVRVLSRGSRTARRTHRLRVPSERLRRGDYRVVVRVAPRGRPAVTASLVARRL